MPICTTFYNMRKDCVYSLSPESLRTMILMRKDVLYECVKRYVKKRKEDPYAFFTASLRTRKFNFSCCGSDCLKEICEEFPSEGNASNCHSVTIF